MKCFDGIDWSVLDATKKKKKKWKRTPTKHCDRFNNNNNNSSSSSSNINNRNVLDENAEMTNSMNGNSLHWIRKKTFFVSFAFINLQIF